jgi:hypothetical protein
MYVFINCQCLIFEAQKATETETQQKNFNRETPQTSAFISIIYFNTDTTNHTKKKKN